LFVQGLKRNRRLHPHHTSCVNLSFLAPSVATTAHFTP
jgi:hypothetical protein